MRYEVCVTSPAGVRAARQAGADRVELCTDLDVGGVTPDPALVDAALAEAAGRLPVHVLVRPRGGDFVWSEPEVDLMRRQVAALAAAGVDGLVLGALDSSGAVDADAVGALVEAARPASVTFHRAFDAARDPFAALDAVVGLGVDRLLTSGAAPTAAAGAGLLAQLVARAGEDLVVMAGGGVTAANAALVAATGVPELHFSARTAAPDGAGLAERIRRIMAAAEDARPRQAAPVGRDGDGPVPPRRGGS